MVAEPTARRLVYRLFLDGRSAFATSCSSGRHETVLSVRQVRWSGGEGGEGRRCTAWRSESGAVAVLSSLKFLTRIMLLIFGFGLIDCL